MPPKEAVLLKRDGLTVTTRRVVLPGRTYPVQQITAVQLRKGQDARALFGLALLASSVVFLVVGFRTRLARRARPSGVRQVLARPLREKRVQGHVAGELRGQQGGQEPAPEPGPFCDVLVPIIADLRVLALE
jgi:hypothetical protein